MCVDDILMIRDDCECYHLKDKVKRAERDKEQEYENFFYKAEVI